MTFNPNIPQASDIISQSQGQILTNFNQANTIFDVDHITFDAAVIANRGKHDKSTYVELAADPVTVLNEVAVYSKNTGTQPEVFYRPELNGTAVRLTGGGVTAAAYVSLNGATGAMIAGSNFNVTGTSRPAQGVYNVNFTRNFINTVYVAIVSPNMTGLGGFAIKTAGYIKAVNVFQVSLVNQTNTFTDAVTVDFVFFGTLV